MAALGSSRHQVIRVIARDPAAVIARESRLAHNLVMIGATADDDEHSGPFSSTVDRSLARLESLR